MPKKFTYEAVPGYFAHDYDATEPLPAVPLQFGLIDTSPSRWINFFNHIRALNDEAAEGTSYKLFLVSRHGQGYHNAAETKYGTHDWDEHWSKLEGDGEIIWGPDPRLTSLGIEQAKNINSVWRTEASAGLPAPHRRYTSPLSRAMDTCDIMFDGVYGKHIHPVCVLESCREDMIGMHVCDKRKTRSYIADYKPHFDIEEGLTEEDELWDPSKTETRVEVTMRAQGVLDMIFGLSADDTFISITAHGGFITGFLIAIGRGDYPVQTGGALPVVIKATSVVTVVI